MEAVIHEFLCHTKVHQVYFEHVVFGVLPIFWHVIEKNVVWLEIIISYSCSMDALEAIQKSEADGYNIYSGESTFIFV